MNSDAQYPVLQYLVDLERLHTARRRIEFGNMTGAWRELEEAPAQLRQMPEYQRVLAEILTAAGRLEQALAAADIYTSNRPDSFDGVELALRLRALLNRTDDVQTLHALGQRRLDLVVRTLEEMVLAYGADWQTVIAAIVRSTGLSNGTKARIVDYVLDHLLDPSQHDELAERLERGIDRRGPRQQLFIGATLLLYFGRTEQALALLEPVIPSDGLGDADFPALFSAYNKRVGWGDQTALRHRHAFLSKVYEAWSVRFEQGMPPVYRQALDESASAGPVAGRIAILTAPLLDERHAPTQRVLEIAASLIRDHGYEVRIFAGGALHYRTDAAIPLVSYSNVDPSLLQADTVRHGCVEIPYWPCFLDDGQRLKFPVVALEILQYRPQAVLCYGDGSPVQALLAGRVPSVLFPSHSAAPVGPADRYVSLWDRATLDARVAEGDWPQTVADRAVFGAAGVRYPTPARSVDRAELVPEAELILAIVGTRIAGEIRGDFATRLARFLAERPGVHLLTLGVADRQRVLGEELLPVADQVHCRGYATNLADLLTGCDIALNPDRQGAGTGSAIAMAAGCPVVSLDRGDTATLLAPSDLSADLDAYFGRLARLVDDADYRAEASGRMAERVEAVLGFVPAMQRLVATVEALAAPGSGSGC